jgi:MFS family permease
MANSSFWRRTLNTLQIQADYEYAPAGLRWRSNTLFIVATVAAGLFTDCFLYGLVVPILPFVLHDRIGVPSRNIQSHVDGLLAAYAGAQVIFSPIAGVLADKISTRQAPFLAGLAALLAATILLFLGTTVPVLYVARILQGMSASCVWTIGLALCLETVGPDNLGKTIGTVRIIPRIIQRCLY